MILSKTQFIKILIPFIICIAVNVQAQQPGTTLAQQYEEVVKKASSYQGHKEIKETKIQALWRNSMDSLQGKNQLLNESRAKLIANNKAIAGLKTELTAKEQELHESKAAVDAVWLLGMSLNKIFYNIIMWGLVLLLAAALGFTVLRTKASLKEARYRSGLFTDLSQEFQEHKMKANDREKKLARELQTERNRIAELSGHIR